MRYIYLYRNSDPHHFNADPDPAFHFNADQDPAFHLKSDPDPAFHFCADPNSVPHQGDVNLLFALKGIGIRNLVPMYTVLERL
jgi:hypothetical protein